MTQTKPFRQDQHTDTLPAGFWWLSMIIILVIVALLLRTIVLPINRPADGIQTATDSASSLDFSAFTDNGLSEQVNDASELTAHQKAVHGSVNNETFFKSLNSHNSFNDSEHTVLSSSATSTATSLHGSDQNSHEIPNLIDTTLTDDSAKPRLPARESVSTLLKQIEARKANPPTRYRSSRTATDGLSRSEKVQTRATYTQENFQSLCADCHLLNDTPQWQADLGPTLCGKVDCSDFTQLSFYIQQSMPPEDPSLCEGACASELALLILYTGNPLLAAMHQMAPALLMQASIQIIDSASGTVLLNRPPLIESP
jgi:hypothetical protein